MARIVTPKPDEHIRLIEDFQRGECCLIRGGTRAYLWAGLGANHNLRALTFSGPVLRKLAYAILREVPATKRRKKATHAA